MYPKTYYETFLRYEASDQIFIAMPFTESFKKVYEEIIEPAINEVKIDKLFLKPRIINRGTTGSPDIHELIFDAILHSRFVIADVSVQASFVNDNKKTIWQPNANVSYEVGLASAWRNPEDILLIYQEQNNHNYSFDIQNLRHFSYDPNNKKCINGLAQEITSALSQSKFLSTKAFQKMVTSLSPSALGYLFQESKRIFPVVTFPRNSGIILDSRMQATTELLSIGALENRNKVENESGISFIYQWTEIGLQILLQVQAISKLRLMEMKQFMDTVPKDKVPPLVLM